MPSHFKVKEYCPLVFRNLRERFGIDDSEYLVRIQKRQKLREKCFPSGRVTIVKYRRVTVKNSSDYWVLSRIALARGAIRERL